MIKHEVQFPVTGYKKKERKYLKDMNNVKNVLAVALTSL